MAFFTYEIQRVCDQYEIDQNFELNNSIYNSDYRISENSFISLYFLIVIKLQDSFC